MKKYIIILGVIVVLGAVWLILRPNSISTDVDQQEILEGEQKQSQIQPSQIKVGLFDPGEEASALTKLLESRLKTLGFQTIILVELVDPQSAQQEKTTLLFRADTQAALKVVEQKVIGGSLYRKGQNEGIAQDVVISAWNIEDINWGDLREEAEKFLHPEPVDVSLLVLNAGAEPGKAGELVSLLKELDYEQAKADNAEEETDWSALIYYQRNFKEVAKDLRKILSDEGYVKVTYRIRLDQEANLVIELGPPQENPATEEDSAIEED